MHLSIACMNASFFSYDLPSHRIARHGEVPRDKAKLLCYDANASATNRIAHRHFDELPKLLPDQSLLVCNNSAVLPVRLFFTQNATTYEVFIVQAIGYAHLGEALACQGGVDLVAWVRQAVARSPGAPTPRDQVDQADQTWELVHPDMTCTLAFISDGCYRLTWDPINFSFSDVLTRVGTTPLPPYMRRVAEIGDVARYQSVFATQSGSVAAPTASLHFTHALINDLQQQAHDLAFLTLHVGAGTFRPLSRTGFVRDHVLHSEAVAFSADFVQTLYDAVCSRRPIIAVGTTALRAVESVYWYGCALCAGQEVFELDNTSWQSLSSVSVEAALLAVRDYALANSGVVQGHTALYIYAPYRCRVVRGLVTNFHQPRSSLLVLVDALVGSGWRDLYAVALRENYRFLSYGDACLFLF